MVWFLILPPNFHCEMSSASIADYTEGPRGPSGPALHKPSFLLAHPGALPSSALPPLLSTPVLASLLLLEVQPWFCFAQQ